MNLKSWLAAGAVLGAIGLASCSSGANITPITIGKSDKFCTDANTFQAQAAALEAAAAQGDLASIQKAAAATRDGLVTLQQDAAKLPDKVNGHLVKDDLAVAARTYTELTTELNAANASDPNAVPTALAKIQASEGQVFTQATGRLDAYTKKVCGLVVSNTTTTTPTSSPPTTAVGTTSTVVGPTGPVGPTTVPAPATTAPGETTTAPSTTAAP